MEQRVRLSSAREAEKRWRYNSELTVQLWKVGNVMTAEAEESPLLEFVTRKRLVKAD
jgi:hypothetical protein